MKPVTNPCGDPVHNQVLAALPLADLQRWLPHLEPVQMLAGQVLVEAGAAHSHLYFPTSAVISLQCAMDNGALVEIAVIGHGSMAGVPLLMGGAAMPYRCVVRGAGKAYRLAAAWATEEFHRAGPVLQLLLRYTQALMDQMAQTTLCNRHHTLDQQLCRWLLLGLDLRPGTELAATQEQIALLLGVRREGVTEAALKLQQAGLIRYSRGRVVVLDRAGLLARSCGCYTALRPVHGETRQAT